MNGKQWKPLSATISLEIKYIGLNFHHIQLPPTPAIKSKFPFVYMRID